MIKFDIFEKISQEYPLDNISNLQHEVIKNHTNVITKADLEFCKCHYPFGYYSKAECRWYHWDICSLPWYDSYVYDGEKWYLGKDSWDGIYPAEEPKWGVHHAETIFQSEFGMFRTIEEAEEYRNKKVSKILEF